MSKLQDLWSIFCFNWHYYMLGMGISLPSWYVRTTNNPYAFKYLFSPQEYNHIREELFRNPNLTLEDAKRLCSSSTYPFIGRSIPMKNLKPEVRTYIADFYLKEATFFNIHFSDLNKRQIVKYASPEGLIAHAKGSFELEDPLLDLIIEEHPKDAKRILRAFLTSVRGTTTPVLQILASGIVMDEIPVKAGGSYLPNRDKMCEQVGKFEDGWLNIAKSVGMLDSAPSSGNIFEYVLRTCYDDLYPYSKEVTESIIRYTKNDLFKVVQGETATILSKYDLEASPDGVLISLAILNSRSSYTMNTSIQNSILKHMTDITNFEGMDEETLGNLPMSWRAEMLWGDNPEMITSVLKALNWKPKVARDSYYDYEEYDKVF